MSQDNQTETVEQTTGEDSQRKYPVKLEAEIVIAGEGENRRFDFNYTPSVETDMAAMAVSIHNVKLTIEELKGELKKEQGNFSATKHINANIVMLKKSMEGMQLLYASMQNNYFMFLNQVEVADKLVIAKKEQDEASTNQGESTVPSEQ